MDDTQDPPVYHPELVETVTVRFLHNEAVLRQAVGDKYYGNADGSLKFVLQNPFPLSGLSVDAILEDTHGTTYISSAPVVKEGLPEILPSNPVDRF